MLEPGDFWRICDRCGRKVAASQTRYQIDDYGNIIGLIVCESCFDIPNIPLEDVLFDEYIPITDPRPPNDEYMEPCAVNREDL